MSALSTWLSEVEAAGAVVFEGPLPPEFLGEIGIFESVFGIEG